MLMKALFEFGEVVEYESYLAQPELWHDLPYAPNAVARVLCNTLISRERSKCLRCYLVHALELDRAEPVKAHVLWRLVEMGEVNGI